MTVLAKPLADIWADLSEQRSILIEALKGLAAHDTLRSPGANEWNAAQVVDHLLLAEGFTNQFTMGMVGQAQAAGEAKGFPPELESFDPLPEPLGMEAPPPIRPQKELAAQELIEALETMEAVSRASFEALATLDPRKLRMPHPLFGELDMGQWWAVHPMHYRMHIAQAQAALGQAS
jgi:DinB superfamily